MGLKKNDGLDFVKRYVKRDHMGCHIYPRKDTRSKLLYATTAYQFERMFGFVPEFERWAKFYVIKE